MRRFDIAPVAVFVSLAIAASINGTALAQQYETTFAIGYSHIETENPHSLLYTRDGGYVDADFAFPVVAPRSPLPVTLGVGITGSGHWDSEDVPFRFSATSAGTVTLNSDTGFFELEPRAAMTWYSHKKEKTGVFIRGRIGAGVLLNTYTIDTVTQTGVVSHFDTLEHTGFAFEIRPAAQVGYSWGPATAGVDISYMAAWGDFGDLGSEAQEARIGVFFGYKF